MEKDNKQYRFFFHYNKPNKLMTIHFKKQCILVKNIKCNVPIETKWNDKQQPNIVLRGFCKNIIIDNNTAIIE